MFAWMNKVFHINIMNRIGLMQVWRSSNRCVFKEIASNKHLKGIHEGKRCYILGNGPSLKKIDLSFLKGKHVFSVNSFSNSPYCNEIKPEFHFWADPSYFDGTYLEEGVIQEWKKMLEEEREGGVKLFLPYTDDARIFFERNKTKIQMGENDSVFWFFTLYDPHPHMKLNPDITKPLPICRTVVQLAAIAAIYMGFSEIVLLGCDGTSVLNDFNSILENREIHQHFYDDEKDEFKQAKRFVPTSEYVCYAQYRVFLMWRLIVEYCQNNNITITNVIDKTLLDIVPSIGIDEFMEGII